MSLKLKPSFKFAALNSETYLSTSPASSRSKTMESIAFFCSFLRYANFSLIVPLLERWFVLGLRLPQEALSSSFKLPSAIPVSISFKPPTASFKLS